jgi:ribonuclease BN (tRNA processing enzyme)
MAISVSVVGCGEAFDNHLPNTSMLVEAESGRLLLDCGYNVPQRIWEMAPDPNSIDLVYLSHPHADHYFGMAPLLVRMWEDKRTAPLTIVSQKPLLEDLQRLLEFGYRGIAARFAFPIEYLEAHPEMPIEWRDWTMRFAPTRHSVTNLAIRLEHGASSVSYSGDGLYTPESAKLYEGVGLLIHEAYDFETSPIHGDIVGVLAVAADRMVARTALVHVRRALRASPKRILDRIAETGASLPKPGDRFEV